VWVAGAGVVAGAMNALAGGGSFVSMPALIAAGVPSVTANASSTVALFPGGVASAWVYRGRAVPIGAAPFSLLVATTVVGGLVGGLLLLWTPNTAFDRVLPWLLLAATAMLALGPRIMQSRRQVAEHPAALLAIQFALGVYGGYFGGAVGIMMMAVWSVLGLADIRAMNAVKVVLVAAANTIAVLCFAFAGSVAWRETLVMLLAAALGGFAGAHATLRLSGSQIRVGISIINFLITAAFFYITFFH
jgi:uncharacterized membrane protein YfcA